MQDTAADAGVWRPLDSNCWDMGSGGSPLVGLQLEDWSESDLISSNGSLTGIGCLASSEQQAPHWGCQDPLPGAFCAQQPACQPPLGFLRIVDARDEVVCTHKLWGLLLAAHMCAVCASYNSS